MTETYLLSGQLPGPLRGNLGGVGAEVPEQCQSLAARSGRSKRFSCRGGTWVTDIPRQGKRGSRPFRVLSGHSLGSAQGEGQFFTH